MLFIEWVFIKIRVNMRSLVYNLLHPVMKSLWRYS